MHKRNLITSVVGSARLPNAAKPFRKEPTRRSSVGSFFAILVCLAVAVPTAYADVIVPNALAGVEGNSNNSFPFNITPFGLLSQRYQQIYASTEFSGPILISGIAFRPDATFGGAFSSTLPNVQISLSTTSAAVDGLSPTFANNVGGNVSTVFSGALSLSSSFTGPPNGPKAFDILITFATPFLYDPALGNLLLDVRNFSGGTTTSFDAQSSPTPDPISRVFSVSSSGVNDPTGVVNSDGLVTKFVTLTPVPEPSSLLLISVGIATFGFLRRRRHH
jgi:hypothetical protein